MSTLIHRTSLAKMIDAVNDAVFFGKTIPATDRRDVARWIAARHALPGGATSSRAGSTVKLSG